MKPPVLAASALSPLYLALLRDRFEVLEPMTAAQAAAHPLRDRIEVIAASGESKVPADLIRALPSLRLIAVMGVGYDGVDVAAAVERGVQVTHTPDVLNDDVADLALALMLDVTRRISAADRHVREGRWPQGGMPLATKLSGKRLGVVGMGRIGRAIATRAQAFGMPIAYHCRRPVADLPYRHVPDLVDLARDSDVLVVITPGGASTHHLINARVLEALGPEGYLVNVARGSVVDEAALVEALKAGRIAGAGLDVFEREPHPLPELLGLPNVVLTPHIGSATHSTRQAMAQLAFDNIDRMLGGKPLVTPVPECR